MITRKVQLQVAVFVLVALVGVSYVGYSYAGLDRMFGGSGMVVQVRLASSGGLFTNGEVTYRGVQVGRVGPMRLAGEGIEADLYLEDSAPPIPADTAAVVTNRSAVGEQYLDLRPRSADGPFLTEGSVIEQDRTSLPPPVEQVMSTLDSMVASVPLDSLRTVVREAGAAFQGTGPELGKLMDSADAFTRTAVEHLPQTSKLITDARTVLNTQVEQAPAIDSFSRDLRLLAEQFKHSDGDLRRLIGATPPAAEETSALLAESGRGLGLVLANLLTPSMIFESRTAATEQLLVYYPLALSATEDVVGRDGEARFASVLRFFEPEPCIRGYQDTVYRPGTDTSPAPELNTRARCTLPYGHPSSVRGSQHAPKGAPAPDPDGLSQLLGVDLLRGGR
ncbi:MCE family protein [Amycolatopsis aidingensis]|uniref:MCE family protein n=1 Tax=Amycolatopsis aidingensis TaxID=2842453 RepID=UPI001C0AA8F5|nr:MlaD family protein [Amycolatopsis aidingensis]